ncbi:MAG: hypothetical protein R3D30_05575 [Hyphomicrobiales bacterium]
MPIATASSKAAATMTFGISSISAATTPPTCRIVSEKRPRPGYELRCFHVPKTIDNDLRENDRTPGFHRPRAS